jgi:hypothetical protein
MRARLLGFTAVFLFSFLSAGAAFAQEQAEAPEPKLGPDYRVQMIVTDVLAMGVFAGAGTLGHAGSISDGATAIGLGAGYLGFVASGAVYHQMYDLKKRTWKSALVRALAPAVFGVSALGFDGCHDGHDCNDRGMTMMVGALIGMLGATVADATILVPEGRTPPPRPQARGITFMPTASVRPDTAQAGIVGTF